MDVGCSFHCCFITLIHLSSPTLFIVIYISPYAPCLLGFEGHGSSGGVKPTIRGIVVHEHNVELLQHAFTEYQSHAVEREHEQRQQQVWKRWSKLIRGILLKDRLQRDYGGNDSDDDAE